MIIKRYYLPENDLENWQMYGIDYYYYSESSVANEAIQAVDARIYTRPGTIHVDMEGKAALSVYSANGACCYQSSITSSTVRQTGLAVISRLSLVRQLFLTCKEESISSYCKVIPVQRK